MFVTPKAQKELFLASSLCDGVEDNNIKQVTTLLDNKEADPNVLIPIYGITPFHLAIGNPSETFAEEVTKLFLRHGGNPNIRSTDGLTPVHIAAAWGRCNVLELLLANGGDPLYLDNEGYNPFHFAFDGFHYKAIDTLRKYCGDSTNDDEEEIKYDMLLEKVLINNRNVVAEYVVTDEQTTGSFNLSPENILEINIKSQNGSSTSDYQIFLKDDFVTQRKNQKENKSSDETETDFKGRNIKEEKLLVSEIISQLSSSLSNEITKTDATNNSDTSLYEKRMQLIPKTTPTEGKKQSLKRRSEFSNNLISGRLKGILKEPNSTKNVSPFRTPRRKTRSPVIKKDKDIKALDNSIISKSPNCNIISRLSKKKIVEKSPLINKHTPKNLNNSIIAKSPNCGIASSADRKINLAKTSTFGKNLTPINLKKPSSKIISRTPSELKSKTYLTNTQKTAQISKSLPRNFQNKVMQRQESPLFKKPVNVERNINSGARKKDTEESSGVYSAASKVTRLKNVAMKLENYISNNLDSSSNYNELENSKIIKEQDTSSSFSNTDDKDSNSSWENMIFELSKSSSKFDLRESDLTEDMTHLQATIESYDSKCNKRISDKVQSKSNLSELSSVNDCKDNVEISGKFTVITEDLTARSILSRTSYDSFISLEEEYRYQDFEEGIVLKERRLCITPSCVMFKTEELTSFYTCSTAESVSSLPQEMLLIDKQTLRQRLTALGENPGPITNSTHKVYLKRLMKLEDLKQNNKNISSSDNPQSKIKTLAIKSSLLSLNWQKDLESYKVLEHKIFQEFARPDPSRKWREGLAKTCFNYLLLDSRITKDLPNRSSNLSLQEKWETFLSAIFYVGKGKQSRPYAHLYDAFHLWVSTKSVESSSKKIKKILDIWNEKQGVVVLHLFHNTIPVEAYTREAAMIDALGVEQLANCKSGEYYGKVATWSNKEKCELGKYLLYKAMEILMVEGERHLSPEHL